jgi:hypothetical protein
MCFENVLYASSRKLKIDLPTKEQHMRSSPYLLAAAAAFGLTALSTSRVDAMNSTSPAGLRAALEAVDLTQPVDCRAYKHKHVGGHGWGTGCEPGVVIREGTSPGPSVNIESGTNRSGNRSGSGGGSSSGGGSNSTTTNTNTNTTTNTGTGAGATTSTTTSTGGATYTGAGAGATSTKATTTTGGATTTTGGTGGGATTSTTGGTAGGTGSKK